MFHKTPNLQTLVPTTQDTRSSFTHTSPRTRRELRRALSQIIHSSRGKRKKISFHPSCWSPTPHSHLPPHTEGHKTHFTTKSTLRVCQGSCYCHSGSTELKEAEGPIFDKHATCFYLYTLVFSLLLLNGRPYPNEQTVSTLPSLKW